MDSARWQKIQNLFHDAAELPQSEQRRFLQAACGEDFELASEVIAMLEHDSTGGSLLDRKLAEVAQQTLAVGGDIPLKDFGPYRILNILGEGGMGVVYLAERGDLGNQVAIKVLRDAWLSPSRRDRFAREQRTLAQLNHPNIAQLYDANTLSDGTPWFAMERVDGIPLTNYCRKHGCSLEKRLQLFRAVCEAVQYAHSNAVIHRDLKPSNILVKDDGTIRLLDFGIAKQMDGLDAHVDQTMTGLRLMTPAYASPEQIRGNQVGIQTDVYSLGVILYELVTGQLPFDLSNLTPAEAATVIAEHEPGKPSVAAKRNIANSDVPVIEKTAWADLDVLCLTAMQKEPQRRYRSVEALIRDIDHFLAGEPLDARADAIGYRVNKFIRRNRRPVLVGTVIFVGIVGMLVFFTIRLTRARNLAQAEAAHTQRIQQFMMNLFQGGDAAAGPAADMKVTTIIDRGVVEAQALSADPGGQADLYETLGSLYQKLGKLDRADTLLQQALKQRQAAFGPNSIQAAASLVALGQLRSDQAQYPEAENFIRQGLDIYKRNRAPDNSTVMNAQTALGSVLALRGNYDQAIHMLDETVRLQSPNGTQATPGLANSMSELANAQYEAGHYQIADPLFRRVLEMHRQLYGTGHPLVADDLFSLGAVQQDLGYYSEAEKFCRQALNITQSYYGTNHPKTAADLTALGRALVYENKFDEATVMLQQALAIQERVYGPVHPAVAEAVNELGNTAEMQDHYDEAEKQFRRVADIYRQVYGDHHYLVAIALSNLAYTYLGKKDYAQAEALFRDVVRRFTETLSADNVNTGIAHIKLGRTLLRENRYADAQVETLAGYENLTRQANPGTSYLHAARKDLAAEYDALQQPEKAAKFRAELAAEKQLTVAKN
jgi:eukaryotic-like serine/threonine-protein kinase